MKFTFNVLSSRLGRRIFAAFVACALIPVMLLAVISLSQVSRQLEDQGSQRLRRAAKSYGLSIYEHLLFCEDELKLVPMRNDAVVDPQRQKFAAIGRRFPDGRYEAILGDPINGITLTPEEKNHLAHGESLIAITRNDIILLRYFEIGAENKGLLMGAIRGDYLWGLRTGNSLPPLTEFAVLTTSGLVLFQSSGFPADSGALLERAADNRLRATLGGADWFVAGWSIFLKPTFETGLWSIVVLQPESYILAPIARFKVIFLMVMLVALLLVVALSLFNLRRSLEPIEALKNGARSIALKDFAHRVQVESQDEFQDLAQSFNAMSEQLGRQFQILSTQAQIDQATLMARDFSHIAGLSISRILKELPFRLVAITRVNVDDADEDQIYLGHRAFPDAVTCHPFSVQEKDLAVFNRDHSWIRMDDTALLGRFLPNEYIRDLGTVVLFPVFVKDRLYALLTVGGSDDVLQSETTLSLMRQITDHLAVAWSNVNLIRDLRHLTSGSMQALARAVDAKSPWTAGHSARVMRIAVGIARHMGLNAEKVDAVQQAALLHDIGKIGISSDILDKPGKLTDDEFAAIRNHPSIGDKILSPINAFKKIIPIVRQHHERWDGKGYPDGLSGEAITLEARILALADVYDAMTSDRPYRKGMDLTRAVSIIDDEAGHQFDPRVVAAFKELIEETSARAA